MFEGSNFNQDISKWDVSNVTDMDLMFKNSKFNRDISNWNVSNVTSMFYMFYESEFGGEISEWNVSNVTNMSGILGRLKDGYNYPYWSDYDNYEERRAIVRAYLLDKELKTNKGNAKRIKI
jgi:surface protein